MKAKIILQFKDVKGQVVTAHRNLVGTQKVGGWQKIDDHILPKLRYISYQMRLKECGLITLETRRLRGDQIEVLKILNGYENIDRNIFSR